MSRDRHSYSSGPPVAEALQSRRRDSLEQRMVGTQSPAMRQVMTLASRVAPIDSTVLITGESGVGKEYLARWLHEASHRASRPFIGVNCGAFADTLLESELFGHVRGAFTGAHRDRVGLFEAAHGGTLFLDEIGEVSPAMQVKLLRVLQAREVQRVGESKARRVDVRLIAATNRTLPHEVAERRFREDLYYRLRVIDLHVPPLRERPEDLRELAAHFLPRMAARVRRAIAEYAPAALEQILGYSWPGNIRELEHAVERACAVASGSRIEMGDLPANVQSAAAERDGQPHRPLRARERDYILSVLGQHHGQRRQAAAALGISLSTLKRRLRDSRRIDEGSYAPAVRASGAETPSATD